MKTNPNDIIFDDKKVDFVAGNFDSIVGGGLTKREYFAAQALAGLCSDPSVTTDFGVRAVLIADETIKALNMPADELDKAL